MPNVQRTDTDFQGLGSNMFLESKSVIVYQILWKQNTLFQFQHLSQMKKIIDTITSIETQK